MNANRITALAIQFTFRTRLFTASAHPRSTEAHRGAIKACASGSAFCAYATRGAWTGILAPTGRS